MSTHAHSGLPVGIPALLAAQRSRLSDGGEAARPGGGQRACYAWTRVLEARAKVILK